MGEELTSVMLANWYYWQEKLLKKVLEGDFAWFDDDKVVAVLPGGTSGRLFNRHRTNQIDSFINGGKLYWWFSDKEIKKHSEHQLILNPL